MRVFAQLAGVLLLVGFIGAYLWWIVAAAALAGLAYYGHRWWRAECRRAGDRAAIAARADQQHAWALAGDHRGVYGEYPPA